MQRWETFTGRLLCLAFIRDSEDEKRGEAFASSPDKALLWLQCKNAPVDRERKIFKMISITREGLFPLCDGHVQRLPASFGLLLPDDNFVDFLTDLLLDI